MPRRYAGRRMELRHLRYFVAVAEEQNVTRAAARLHVSQPPLSRQIRDLEDELGVALFDHGAKAVRLTEAGRVFLTEARAVVQRADEAVQTVKAVASGQRGEIHVGYAPSLTVELLPRALRFFQEANPGVRVQLHDLSTQEMLRGLRDGKLHVALLIQLSAKVLAGLVFEELHRYAVCVAVHPAHPLARARKVGLEQVANERLIAYHARRLSRISRVARRLVRAAETPAADRKNTTAPPVSSRRSKPAGAWRWFNKASIVWPAHD